LSIVSVLERFAKSQCNGFYLSEVKPQRFKRIRRE
jgi:hypothetical protein